MASEKKTKYSPRLPKGVVIYDVQCPVLHTLELIGGKWKLPILWHLADQETVRYNALKRSVMGITNMMLNKCLKELEESGLVTRTAYEEVPPRVEYSLTPCGQSLLPALRHLYAWGEEYIRDHKTPEQGSAQEAMHERK